MPRPSIPVRPVLALVLLLVLAGCASPSPGATTTTPSAPAPSAQPPSPAPAAASPSLAASVAPSPAIAAQTTVQTTDALKFDPATLTVAKGTTVTWRNTSQIGHTVTADPSKAETASDAVLPSGVQPWDAGTLNPGSSVSHTFDVPGTYKYFCQPHEAAGMLGTIVVTP
jgi:plastocyanin